MARLLRLGLFRRLSSRGDTSPDRSHSPPSPPASAGLPSSSAGIPNHYVASPPRGLRKSKSLPKLRKRVGTTPSEIPETVAEQRESGLFLPAAVETESADEGEFKSRTTSGSETLGEERSHEALLLEADKEKTAPEVSTIELGSEGGESVAEKPVVVVEAPTPDVAEELTAVQKGDTTIPQPSKKEELDEVASALESAETGHVREILPPATSDSPTTAPFSPETARKLPKDIDGHIRRPSLIDSANVKIVKTLLDSPFKADRNLPTADSSTFPTASSRDQYSTVLQDIRAMVQRKIWVKRPGASATLVQIREDDLVDDVREMILRKYANSLGKTFDAPDMTLSIASRVEPGQYRNERILGPEEEICRTIDSYYPGGQTVDEALIINVPQRRTPRPSPKVFSQPNYHTLEDYRPLENGTDYFPPMAAMVPASVPQTSGSHESRSSNHHHPSVAAPSEPHPRSISVLNTGHIPPLPSPGGTARRHTHRPKYIRQPTSSPTIMAHPTANVLPANQSRDPNPPPHVHRASTRPRLDSSAASEPHPINLNGIQPAPPPLATPPAQEQPPTNKSGSNPSTPSGAIANTHAPLTHRPTARPRRSRKPTPEDKATSRTRGKNDPAAPSINTALDSAAVPPINVLIVEDNIINLRILEGLMKRLKVRWQTAMNGQIAVDKWRTGGFHLVLMDIQMPIMNGLQAAREIRRLERVNGIGVFGELESPLSTTGQKDANGGAGGTAAGSANGETNGDGAAKVKSKEDDKLQIAEGLFKSPVIIVALTASSLQSDRHEALAAGCNDFLNKPVNLVWLERKVKEWGCMQALIDYDGWRKWKDYAAAQEAGKTEEEKAKEREKEEKAKVKSEKLAKLQEKQAKAKEEKEREKKKRMSLNVEEGSTPATTTGEGEGGGGGGGGAATAVNEPTAALKTGLDTLKDANFELG